MALDWLRCRAWDPFGTVVAAAVCVAGVGLGDMDHRPSLCVAGVALGDIDRHFAWQAWHLWHWTGSGGALGTYTHTYIHTCETRVQEKNAMDHLGLKKRDGKQKLR